jgi:hypothetical protein
MTMTEAQDVASDKLAAAFFTMMRARKARAEGRVSEGKAIYDGIALQPTRSADKP